MPERSTSGFEGSAEGNIGERGSSLNRREFLTVAGASYAALVAEDKLRKLYEEKLRLEQEKSLKGTEHIPGFVLEDPIDADNEYADLVPENILDLIDAAWIALEDQEAGFTVEKIQLAPKKGKSRSKKTKKGEAEYTEKLRHSTLLATADLSGKESADLHFVRLNESGESVDDGHNVQVGVDKGMGTNYEVTVPVGHAVLAVKRAIRLDGEFQEVISTPYSQRLNVPIVRKAGFDYLANLFDSARKSLAKPEKPNKPVHSLLFRGELVSNVVPHDLALQLVIVEKVDPYEFKRRSQGLAKETGQSIRETDVIVMKEMANEVLTTVGVNRDFTGRYAKSSKGARGMFQLMPGPYRNIQKNLYPGAGLNSDFPEGAADHLNAAKAALLWFDSDFRDAIRAGKKHLEILRANPEALGMYLAACYNAGSKQIVDIMIEEGNGWPRNLSSETTDYVRKFEALRIAFNEDVGVDPKVTKEHIKLPEAKPEVKIEAPEVKGPIVKGPELHIPKEARLADRNRDQKRRREDIPEKLRGSAKSMRLQRDKAKEEKLVYIRDRKHLEELIKSHPPILLPLPESEWLKISDTIPKWRRYCLPETAKFLTDLAEASHKHDERFEPIMVNSAVRPLSLGLVNKNASPNSVHPTGSTVDIAYNAQYETTFKKDRNGKVIVETKKGKNKGKAIIDTQKKVYNGMSLTQIKFMEKYLIDLEDNSHVEATEERQQACFHVMVLKNK